MNRFGKVIWGLTCDKAKQECITHPIEFLAQEVVPVGPKTLRNRLNNGQWLADELSALAQWFAKDKKAAETFAAAVNEEYNLFPPSFLKESERGK